MDKFLLMYQTTEVASDIVDSQFYAFDEYPTNIGVQGMLCRFF